jgi:hypothetical protein
MKKFWLSWYGARDADGADLAFAYDGPWWQSGELFDDGTPIFVAAVIAASPVAAHDVIRAAHDDGVGPKDWRFCEERSKDWSPFCERFPRAPWMKWEGP